MKLIKAFLPSYVYWTVHRLDGWIKRGQLDVTCFLFHDLMLNMFRMLVHPSSGACDLFADLFHGLYCSGMICVGVTLWFGWGGVVSGCRLMPFRFNWYRHSDGSGTWNKDHMYCIVMFSASSPLFQFLVILHRVHQVWSDQLDPSESREYQVFLARRELLDLLAAL